MKKLLLSIALLLFLTSCNSMEENRIIYYDNMKQNAVDNYKELFGKRLDETTDKKEIGITERETLSDEIKKLVIDGNKSIEDICNKRTLNLHVMIGLGYLVSGDTAYKYNSKEDECYFGYELNDRSIFGNERTTYRVQKGFINKNNFEDFKEKMQTFTRKSYLIEEHGEWLIDVFNEAIANGKKYQEEIENLETRQRISL